MRMKGGNSIAEMLTGDVGIYFGGREAAMAEHLLDSTEVGTVLDEFGGEAMSKAVGADVLVKASVGDSLFDHLKDTHAREVRAAAVEEDIIFLAGGRIEMAADVVDIGKHEVESTTVDRHPAFLAALAEDL